MNRQKERKEKKCGKIIDLTPERKKRDEIRSRQLEAFTNKRIMELVSYYRKPFPVRLACQTQIHYEQIIIIILAKNKFP